MTTVQDLAEMAGEEPITMLTAYDAPTAAIVEAAGVDVILVGDSMGNAVLGHDSTLPVTVEEVRSRTAAVSRATDDVLVVADMPFLSYGVEESDTIENCGRMLKEADANAVKLESGPHTVELTERLVELGIPVMAHLGLTPQRVHQLGGYFRQGTDEESAAEMLDLARAHADAGAFAVVLEHVPSNVASQITEEIDVPTIGIGAGPDTDGQVLVLNDVFGMSDWTPYFAEQFGDVKGEMENAVEGFREAVESGDFPADEHSYDEEEIDEIY
ncbi:3-methyl-2-oxobutanoate hydroxymethyltransferase [Halorussus amylolyticus]|uniref:3-methyl-2-oxobutanoate hydroxymethyltransferase n=1 Tax=Halorussus amylolyticus TaxID=1126242 RepID=UPI00104F32E2|nr:3-methyl-2-oxobutanoate hydroxymethyltransferase [Halorussus amylolyticus]